MKKKKTKILLVVAIAIVLILAVNLIGAVMKASKEPPMSSVGIRGGEYWEEEKLGDGEDEEALSGIVLSELLSILTKPVMSSTALITLTAGIFIAKIAREDNDGD